MKLIADEKILFRSPAPESIFCFTPALLIGEENRIIAAVDLGGPGTAALEGPRSRLGDYSSGNQVRLFLSDDEGKTWRESASRLPMRHEILFRAGKTLYTLGNAPELVISKSCDNGEHWSEPAVLRADAKRPWHQSSTTPVYRNGRVYLVYEQYNPAGCTWPNVRQFFMSAPEEADLCDAGNWRFSPPFDGDPLCGKFRELCDLGADWFPGILETHVLPVSPGCGHLYVPGENSFLLCSRFNTPGFQLGAILKGIEHPDGALEITLFPGRMKELPLFVVPFPGGALKFHPLFDEESRLYFLAANQPRTVFAGGFTGPVSNRRKLVLWCSRDAVSWQDLGVVAFGPAENAARSYPHMAICGNDLLIAVRSGDEKARNQHDNNLVTLHRVRDFRALAAEAGI